MLNNGTAPWPDSPATDLPVRIAILRMVHQLAWEKIELAGGNFDLRRAGTVPLMDPPHKTGIAQAQHRHQPYRVTGELINIFSSSASPSPLIKLRRSYPRYRHQRNSPSGR